jgi:N-acetyl-beta-hexosaminidase
MWCNDKQGNGLPHPLKNATWDFMDSLFGEYRGVFAEDYINIGGDEIDTGCWEQDSLVLDWLAKNGHAGDMNYMIAYFYMRLIASVRKVRGGTGREEGRVVARRAH